MSLALSSALVDLANTYSDEQRWYMRTELLEAAFCADVAP